MIKNISLQELCAKIRGEKLPVATHSGKVEKGGVFVVMPAPVTKDKMPSTPGGEKFIANALENFPAYIVLEPRHLGTLKQLAGNAEISTVLTEDPRSALGEIARAAYGTGEKTPKIIAITGTNGKTTETYLLENLFAALGKKIGVLGTVAYRWPGYHEDAPLTTPDCLLLHSMLAKMSDAGVDTVFMEVSSHAIDQNRIAGLDFSGALMTNLTQDHLDYHKDMEDYFETKARLFRSPAQGGLPFADKVKVANADDEHCRRVLAENPGSIGFGIMAAPVPGSRHLAGTIVKQSPAGLTLSMEFEGQKWELTSPLVGGFNAMNLLGAQAMGLALGLSPADLKKMEHFSGVTGRLERIPNSKGLNVFVDYAHTPDALIKAISALRDAGFARIVTVFGCGGNRDRTKRPLMGRAVAEYSDVAVLTSDNPRFEDPLAIIEDVLPGLENCRELHTDPDRRAAIKLALGLITKNDALLVAGKGHETYQIIQGVKHPFSDQETLKACME